MNIVVVWFFGIGFAFCIFGIILCMVVAIGAYTKIRKLKEQFSEDIRKNIDYVYRDQNNILKDMIKANKSIEEIESKLKTIKDLL